MKVNYGSHISIMMEIQGRTARGKHEGNMPYDSSFFVSLTEGLLMKWLHCYHPLEHGPMLSGMAYCHNSYTFHQASHQEITSWLGKSMLLNYKHAKDGPSESLERQGEVGDGMTVIPWRPVMAKAWRLMSQSLFLRAIANILFWKPLLVFRYVWEGREHPYSLPTKAHTCSGK